MTVAHVFIGTFDLPVPLSAVLIGAVAVVAFSFGLIYIIPPREEPADGPGRPIHRAVVVTLQTLALVYLVFLVAIGIFGRQSNPALNGATIAFWVLTIPLLPIAHCVLGGMYEMSTPFALAARLVSGGASARRKPGPLLERAGYWPSVVLLFLLFWFELALRIVPTSPRALGLLTVAYATIQVAMGVWLGEGWYARGDVFQALTSLASSIAPATLVRGDEGVVRLRMGFRPARALPEGPGRQALITLWLAGVLADGVRVTPIWKAVTASTQQFSDSVGQAGTVDLGSLIFDTAEIVFTWLAFSIFFWVFTYLAATLSRRDPRQLAPVVAPSLIPIALAYLLAHNLTQLVIVSPLIWTAGDASLTTVAFQIQDNIRGVNPAAIFFIQVGAIVAGHVVAVVMAHARLSKVEKNPAMAIRADLGWLAAMLLYTATSLWVLAQPITNRG
ncbi:MAG: hypothetical protein ACYDGR_07655 [Candidatus Dormibacteria bacterium]